MELTVAQKLDFLLKLQEIDSNLDDIKKIRGDLPEEVRDLEDDIIGFETRLGKFGKEVEGFEEEVTRQKMAKKDAEKLIVRYKEQQNNVRNNREFEAISKEIELQTIEIELAEKKTREADLKVKLKKEEVKATEALLSERKEDLKVKKKELDALTSESHEDEKKLLEEREKRAALVEERLYKSYTKIRANSGNGLAVVQVRRGACGGCFNVVPPQRQADIREKKKITVCEHCGRILADVDMENK
ncbi:MAG: hypothetical protein EAZ32_01975 [Cytophagia bacterium]|nr:MAG: hypothetical protein EAZ46_01600 [Runella sp.]TAG22727.1 MAG: hypothetical protein EAZ38_05070 [Cytophagales bacterium]TAG41805.1 MAG: hypothetical protein EAZ32_01975 [Cytophagia bacterium]TAG50860.1 MAG: hypothetical protein EAZ29_11455 [Runella slithyformis]TAG71147.1 MAG: hypothetical protein EAZ26_05410 [Runella slithyformis]